MAIPAAGFPDQRAHYVKHLAFDKSFERYTPFPSRSDAMIASLVLALKAGPELMDAIFAIIHDPTFDPSEMVLRRTEDIYLHLPRYDFSTAVKDIGDTASDQRYADRGAEISEVQRLARSNLTSPIVLEETIAWIDDVIQDRHYQEKWVLKNVLATLSLVQRRWTYPARRALGRSLMLEFPGRGQVLSRCLANPFIGSWSRRFYFRSHRDIDACDTISIAKTLNIALAERMTGVQKFVYTFNSLLLATDLFESTLSLLGSTKELVLTPISARIDQEMTPSHYRSIISMPSLKNLTLVHWDLLDAPCHELPSSFALFKPSPSLQALHLQRPYFYSQNELPRCFDSHLVWTRDQLGDFFLSTFVIHESNEVDAVTPEECESMLPLFPRLETLYISGPLHNKKEVLIWLFNHCPRSLRRLHFGSRGFPSEEVMRSIPSTVRKLSLQFGNQDFQELPVRWEDIDALLCRLISSDTWPELRTFRIYYHEDCPGVRGFNAQSVRLNKVEKLCKEQYSIDFRVHINPFTRSMRCHSEHINDVMDHLDILHDLGRFLL